MGKRLFTVFSFLMVLMIAVPQAAGVPAPAAKTVQDMSIFQADKFDAHYRVPSQAGMELLLDGEKVTVPAGGTMQSLTEQFQAEFIARNPDTVNPQKLQQLLKQEKGKEKTNAAFGVHAEEEQPKIYSLVVPVEFAGTDTFDWCTLGSVTTSGPLHNEIPAPGPRDNNTLWYEDATPALYEEMYFGEGPDAGLVVTHPNLGTVDLRGSTMVNYYLEQSGGAFRPYGEVYPEWLQASHSEGWYGADSCSGASHNVRAGELVEEVIGMLNAKHPDFAWQSFDGNADGVVDNFTVIHAGMGQESGGGSQGDFSIWSHASMVGWPDGVLVCSAGSAGCPDRDILVREYSMDPENLDLGVIAEEFGHAAFGLPDIYTTDYQQSVANWAIMEAGSWNGILGGAQPAPFPLWFRYLLGWADPVEMNYDTALQTVTVGQFSQTPDGLTQGIKINVPDKEVTVPNPLDSGKAWWSSVGDASQFTLARELDLTGAAAPVFSFNSYWSIEEGWDYAYVEASTDGGATWAILTDTSGFCTTDPGEANANEGCGLTGENQGLLTYDLSAYAGQMVWLRLRYSTDAAVQWAGWWADDFSLADGATILFSDDVETSTAGWSADGFTVVPLTNSYKRYYLAEWRNASGFDEGLQYPYLTVYSDEDEWEVDRSPYSVPGMLLYFRDASYDFDYTLDDSSIYDSPAWGPKHPLTIIDSHFLPLTWDTNAYASGAARRVGARTQPANATFALQPTTPYTLRLAFAGMDEPVETKTFEPQPAVQQFHDALGYYPGFYLSSVNGGLYWADFAASSIVPAMGDYTSRITWEDYVTPLFDLYGYDLGGTILGSGNPGDSDVQYGLHIAPVAQADDGSWAKIAVWNSTSALVDVEVKANADKVQAGNTINYVIKVTNNTTVPQPFTVKAPIPVNTTFKVGKYYDEANNAFYYEGVVKPGEIVTLGFQVRVDKEVAAGTVITNVVTVYDEATGADSSTILTTVSKVHRITLMPK